MDKMDYKKEFENLSAELSGSEAVYGLLAWLTCRKERVLFGSDIPASEAAELADEFCKVNRLTPPRPDWTDRLTHPK